jgi:hypothetical protein
MGLIDDVIKALRDTRLDNVHVIKKEIEAGEDPRVSLVGPYFEVTYNVVGDPRTTTWIGLRGMDDRMAYYLKPGENLSLKFIGTAGKIFLDLPDEARHIQVWNTIPK